MNEIIIIGLGSNLGERQEHLQEAINLLSTEMKIIAESSIYESEAMLLPNSPENWDVPFYNMVVAGQLKQKRSPQEFLKLIKIFEKEIGRQDGPKWSPRVIDIDILAWGKNVHDSDDLKIPHPGILEREFVVRPVAEILPGWVHPITKKKITDYLKDFE